MVAAFLYYVLSGVLSWQGALSGQWDTPLWHPVPPFFHISFYCKPSKKQGGLHEMYEILREMHLGKIDTIEFRNYD